MTTIAFLVTALWRGSVNLWRRLRRRRIDWVRMELSGALPELTEPLVWWQRGFGGVATPVSLQLLRRRFERLADDPHIRGVVLIIRDLSAGWASIQSLHEILRLYRDAGKRVVAYLPAADTRTYFAACGADTVLMPPTAYLNLTGLRVELTFFGDALRLAGLEAEVIAVSPYKSGGDQLTRASLSPEAREQLERLMDDRFSMLVETIATARGLSDERVRALVDRAPFRAAAGCEAGLLDGALYEDELEAYLQRLDSEATPRTAPAPVSSASGNPELALIDWLQADRWLPLPPARRERRFVGVIPIIGAIATGPSRRSPLPLPILGGSLAGSDTIVQALRRAERDTRVAAVVMHIDSPGGDSFASDLIWREALRLSRHKPLVVSMGDVAASGGYYIAAPARAIVARPATLTGSIGVYAVRPNGAALLKRARIGVDVISRGANSGLFSPLRPLEASERDALTRTVFETYAIFKDRVREGRGIEEERLEPMAGGRVWTGREAALFGLVDDLGGLPAAVARARELASLPSDPRPTLLIVRGGGRRDLLPRPFPSDEPRGWLPALLEEALRTRVLTALPFVFREA
ncbi:MAG: S49 family peptidase [Chloroflexaceae bacterium]